MKLTMKWGGKVRNRNTFKPEPKIPWDRLGLTDPAKEKVPMPIDEVRRQVLMMSSPGLGHGGSDDSVTKSKKDARVPTSGKRTYKPRRDTSK
jgi:hypothetical protein